VGNRTTRTADAAVTTYGYDAFSNRLETVTSPATIRVRGYSESGATVSYANGTGKVLQTALYDATDRLVKAAATRGGTLGKYAHNALGQRVAKRVDGVTTHFIYNLSGQLIAEHDEATGTWRRFYVRLDGMLLGGAKQGQPGTGAIHVDHLGTPQKITDIDGAVVWDAVYRPFGKTESIAGALTFNLRFPGQYYDAETKLHYNYFRDYDPKTGRYVESDPIGLGGGWNTYAYVGGNPVMRVDPRGLFKLDCPKCKWGSTISGKVEQQAKNACARVSAIITDEKLRKCIEKRCNDNGTIICTDVDCPKPKLAYNVSYKIFKLKIYSSKKINICVNNFPSNTNGFGMVAIHEFAHSCRWDHNEGKGVPGNNGKSNSMTGY